MEDAAVKDGDGLDGDAFAGVDFGDKEFDDIEAGGNATKGDAPAVHVGARFQSDVELGAVRIDTRVRRRYDTFGRVGNEESFVAEVPLPRERRMGFTRGVVEAAAHNRSASDNFMHERRSLVVEPRRRSGR